MSGKTYFQRVQELTSTLFWINNVTQKEAFMAIEAGATGCTQNPSYTLKMVKEPEESERAYEIMDGILAKEAEKSVLPSTGRELPTNCWS